MAVTDLFSKRRQRERGAEADVYVYDQLPHKLRVQVVQIIKGVMGFDPDNEQRSTVTTALDYVLTTLRKEYGVFDLFPTRFSKEWDSEELFGFFLEEKDAEKCLDVIELCFGLVNTYVRQDGYLNRRKYDEISDDAIDELNVRFKENCVGYQFIEGEIIRVDSELIHVEAVKPALKLLNTKEYQGAHDEFISAYDHYRHGKTKEALNDCLKSFESTMKAICTKRGWAYSPNDTAKILIDICFKNGLIPQYWQTQMASLRSLLESSIPTGRNKTSGHGQGVLPTVVPDYLAAYMLHMTASTLVFLTTAEKALP